MTWQEKNTFGVHKEFQQRSKNSHTLYEALAS